MSQPHPSHPVQPAHRTLQHAGLGMVLAASLSLTLGCASMEQAPATLPAELRIVPPEVAAQQACKEHVQQPAPPSYPAKARAEARSGWALVGFALDGRGTAQQPVIVNSSGGAEFERAALEALAQTRFKAGVSAPACRLVFDWVSVRRVR